MAWTPLDEGSESCDGTPKPVLRRRGPVRTTTIVVAEGDPIVDADTDARIAEPYARAAAVPLLHLALQDRRLRILDGGRWSATPLTRPGGVSRADPVSIRWEA